MKSNFKKLKITVTFSSMMVAASLVTAGAVAAILIPASRSISISQARSKARDFSEFATELIRAEDLKKIKSPEDQKTANYKDFQKLLDKIVDTADGSGYAYIWRIQLNPQAKHGVRIFWVVDNEPIGSKMFKPVGAEYPSNETLAKTFHKIAKSKGSYSAEEIYHDYAGSWISGYSEIYTDQQTGEIIVVGVDISAKHIESIQRTILVYIGIATALALLVTIPLGIFSGRWITHPLRVIANRLKELSELELKKDDAPIPGTWILEIEQLSGAISRLHSAMSSFALYLPQAVVKKLLDCDEIAKNGGATRDMAIMFTDIRNFTTYTETTEITTLMPKLNEYFNLVTKEIVNTGGTIDKFIGDSVMSFWGAPNDHPNPASNACLAALAIRNISKKLSKKWSEEGVGLDFYTRIGLNYGGAVVGNMGSDERINYTAIGDTVNTASRLEGLGKDYSTDIVVSRSIVEAVIREGNLESFIFTKLDEIRARGKKELTEIYSIEYNSYSEI